LPDRVVVGRVGRPHGLDGSFVVENASEDPARFAPGATVFAGEDRVRVEAAKRAGNRLVIRLDRAVPRGTSLEILATELPQPEEDSYYVFQLVGLEVVEEGGRLLGRVRGVEPYAANDVLELDSGALLPMVEDCVRKVDLDAGRIVVAPGFVDRQ
jgi:16S rRNA processing protein RimM